MYNPEVPHWSLCIVVFLLDFPLDNPSSLLRSLAVTVPELWCSRVVSQTLSTEQIGFLAIRGEVGKRRGGKYGRCSWTRPSFLLLSGCC